ncbi:MAG: RND efflux membrane fusion protein [uncultured Sulfurovum sp.]|uniref:RND efflux membrane fusion protein n=1 Tax=uncultured Sulfurovum sp. TaxID=269237 RepID=A0A6S6T0I1_9BACT|nr:MAG: RND efflux membrane fusion protein [uncultured Sulfurovum sp.]
MKNDTFNVLKKVELNTIVKKVWMISFFIVLFFIGILFLPWQQTVKGTGFVTPLDPTERNYMLLATMDGFIEKFHVQENQFVKKGTPLFSMVDLDKTYINRLEEIESSTKEQYENAKEIIKASKGRKEKEQEYLTVGLNVYVQKRAQIKDKIRSLKFQQTSLKKNKETVKLNFRRVEILYMDGIESRQNYEKMQNMTTKATAELEKNYIDIEVEKTNLDILSKEREKFLKENESKIKSLENNILLAKNKLKSLDQNLQRQATNISRYGTSQVVAEKDGYIVRLLNNDKNKFIKKGENIMQFAPKATLKSVLLKVSDFNMPLIKEGLPTRIMFYGWPALQISGWPTIKFGTFGGIIKKVEAISHEQGFYYAYIVEDPNEEPWPNDMLLRMGTQSTVWVRLNTVPIWYQIWRLMNAFPPQMLTPEVKK